jgi:hypothetical protein
VAIKTIFRQENKHTTKNNKKGGGRGEGEERERERER